MSGQDAPRPSSQVAPYGTAAVMKRYGQAMDHADASDEPSPTHCACGFAVAADGVHSHDTCDFGTCAACCSAIVAQVRDAVEEAATRKPTGTPDR